MTETEHRTVIEALEGVIRDTHRLLERFEATGMEENLPADYQQLHEILDSAIARQREHTLAMLDQTP